MSGPLTQDRFLGGRLALAQPARGHRAGTDAALLAACVGLPEGGTVFDLGAGVGAAGLAVALCWPLAELRLVEREPEIAELARGNIAANGLSARSSVIEADIAVSSPLLSAEQADVVIMNPPFHRPGSTRLSPELYRRRSHQTGEGGDEAWLRRAASLLRPGGIMAMVHRADALPRLLPGLIERFGDLRLLPVLPHADEAAARLLVRGRKGSRAPLAILPGLVLHEADGRFTPLAAALHEGAAAIDWSKGGGAGAGRATLVADQ